MMHGHERHERPGFYRARDGFIFGVCKGIARHLDVSAFWVRVGAVVLGFMTFPWSVLVYVVLALLMKPEPVVPFREDADREFYHSYVSDRAMALQRLRRTFDGLDRRIRRMEDIVTNREYDWDRRLNEGR